MRAVLLGLAALLSGCATGYHSSGFSGGFDETALAPNVYKVSFNGNGYTSSSRAEELALLRSADLTLSKGYHFFALANSEASASSYAMTQPTTTTTNVQGQAYGNQFYGQAQSTTVGGGTYFVSKPSRSNLVVMFPDRPQVAGMVFDAAFICQSIGQKYKATCGAPAK